MSLDVLKSCLSVTEIIQIQITLLVHKGAIKKKKASLSYGKIPFLENTEAKKYP